MLNIIEAIEKAMVVGNIKFAESNIRPGESFGIGTNNAVYTKVSVVDLNGTDVIVYTLPMVSSTIYATDSLEEFQATLLNEYNLVVLGSNRKGNRNKLSIEHLRELQNHSGICNTDYGFVGNTEATEILSQLAS